MLQASYIHKLEILSNLKGSSNIDDNLLDEYLYYTICLLIFKVN